MELFWKLVEAGECQPESPAQRQSTSTGPDRQRIPPDEFKLLGELADDEQSASFLVQIPRQKGRTGTQDEDQMLDIGGSGRANYAVGQAISPGKYDCDLRHFH